MTENQNQKPNPIEKAIGKRAKAPKTIPQAKEPTLSISSPPEKIPDEPSQEEMRSLEDLNRETEERLLDNNQILEAEYPPHQIETQEIVEKTTPASNQDPLPATKTSTQESQPPQKRINIKEETKESLLDEAVQKKDEANTLALAELLNQKKKEATETSAEDKELIELKKYILDNGFTEAGVAMHVVMLCSQPLVTPLTTGWDYVDRASIPNMVLTILQTPGYLEGIWPSLRIVMATNKGNTAWTAEIAITLAYFDCIRTIPALVEIKESK